MFIRTIVFIVLNAMVSVVIAEETGINELFQSDVVYTQEKGELQLTIRPEYRYSGSTEHWSLPLAAEYGLNDNLQIEIEWVSYTRDSEQAGTTSSGQGDLSAGLQYSWFNVNDEQLHLSLGIEVTFDVGDDALALNEDDRVLEPFFIIAFSPEILTDVEAFLEIGKEISSGENETFFNVGAYGATGALLLSLEYNWEQEERYLTPGISWRWQGDWETGIGLPIGLNSGADDYRLIFLLIWEG